MLICCLNVLRLKLLTLYHQFLCRPASRVKLCTAYEKQVDPKDFALPHNFAAVLSSILLSATWHAWDPR